MKCKLVGSDLKTTKYSRILFSNYGMTFRSNHWKHLMKLLDVPGDADAQSFDSISFLNSCTFSGSMIRIFRIRTASTELETDVTAPFFCSSIPLCLYSIP